MTFSVSAITENESVDRGKLKNNINQKYEEWKNLRKLNQRFDVGINLSTIVLGFAIAVLSIESIQMDDNFRKGSIGVLGGVISVGQAISTKFSIRKKAEGYRLVESRAMALENDLDIAREPEKLLEIHQKLNSLILDAAGLERGD